MEKKQSPFAVVQIGIGIVGILLAGASLMRGEHYVQEIGLLLLAIAVLLYGITNNNTDKSEKGKAFSQIAALLTIVASALILYGIYFN